MDILKYKNFIGSAEYSSDDDIFYGKIEGIDGLVNYEGSNVEELQRSFRQAVDDYIIYCK